MSSERRLIKIYKNVTEVASYRRGIISIWGIIRNKGIWRLTLAVWCLGILHDFPDFFA